MAFDRRNFNIEEWLSLENEGLLEKICSVYDGAGRIVEQRKTRINIVPIGSPDAKGIKSLSAPSLSRKFIYDGAGGVRTTVPEMVEWSQACEDIAQGTDPSYPPIDEGAPINLPIVKTSHVSDEQLLVPYNIETTVVSYTVPVSGNIYLRDVIGSGDNKGTYKVYVDGVLKKTKRTWWGDFNAEFSFASSNGGAFIQGGSTVTLKVTNDSNSAETFDGTIGYVLA